MDIRRLGTTRETEQSHFAESAAAISCQGMKNEDSTDGVSDEERLWNRKFWGVVRTLARTSAKPGFHHQDGHTRRAGSATDYIALHLNNPISSDNSRPITSEYIYTASANNGDFAGTRLYLCERKFTPYQALNFSHCHWERSRLSGSILVNSG